MPRSSFPAALLFAAAIFASLLLSCSKQDRRAVNPPPAVRSPANPSQPGGPKQTPSPSADPGNEDQILLSVSKALRRTKLLGRPDQCYAYSFDPAGTPSAYTVDVRENHNHPECGGDPQTQPHLFTVRVDKTTHALSQDARSPGIFQPIQP